jgi:hypothetical protein
MERFKVRKNEGVPSEEMAVSRIKPGVAEGVV